MDQKTELEKHIKEETLTTFVLYGEVVMSGSINWFDNYNINITTTIEGKERDVTIHKSGILCYYETKESDNKLPKAGVWGCEVWGH